MVRTPRVYNDLAIRITTIVPTYARPASLERCLDALSRQQHPLDELLVVVRPTDEASLRVLDARAQPLRIVTVESRGVVAALNAGIDASSGDIVALTDDDAEPHPDWLARLAVTYARDPRIGAVGGRDLVYVDGRLLSGAESTVGTMGPWGRITGNHHVGFGPARDVAVLKGANLSMRGELIRTIRIDERLRGSGTEHHWELGLCLAARRRRYRVVYDPAIAVDHRPQPRIDDSREHGWRETRDAAHNSTLAVLESLPAGRGVIFCVWAATIGTRTSPGVAQVLRSIARGRGAPWRLWAGAQAGLVLGVATYARSRSRVESGAQLPRARTEGSPPPPANDAHRCP